MSSASDVVIVGAGIVGAACARECARRGLRTTVCDTNGIGGGATAAGMGHVVVMDDSPAQLALTHYSQKLWHEVSGELTAQVEFEACGTLWVAADEEEMGEVQRKRALYASAGVKSEVLDSQALAEAEPHLRRPLPGALLVGSDVVLYPPAAAGHLMRDAMRMGARLETGHRVVSAGKGQVRLDNGTELHAGLVVNACGADATMLLPGLPVRKRRGHLVITDRYPGFVRHQLVELGYLKSAHSVAADSVAFNVQPRTTGQLLIGSSREFGAETAAINHTLLAAMVARAQLFLPEIGDLQAIRVWTGFRAATPDKLPLIGPWPEDDTLFLATGHEGLGITTSLATARLLVAGMLREKAEIPAEPYLPGRFLQGSGENGIGEQSMSQVESPEGSHV
ncbi:MAG TPA: FAD-dependent oxidoreductase [Acidobacteriaceae bacterium]|jgi:glycine/D-amino acid oxidase-like deaminating enzyme|nr:FAD-dependent oxidoreductase [Acidobacteriaceae bacterium]